MFDLVPLIFGSSIQCTAELLFAPSSGRNGKVRVLSFKTGLVCLCNVDVQEKYKCECVKCEPRVHLHL